MQNQVENSKDALAMTCMLVSNENREFAELWQKYPEPTWPTPDFIHIPTVNEPIFSKEFEDLGGKKVCKPSGHRWLVPNASTLYWLTFNGTAQFFLLKFRDGRDVFIGLKNGALDIVKYEELPTIVHLAVERRFDIKPENSFLKRSTDCQKVRETTRRVQEIIVDERKIYWEHVFCEIHNFVYGVSLCWQSQELEDIGCTIQKGGIKLSGRWNAPDGSKIYSLRHVPDTSIVDRETKIVLRESLHYYVMKCKNGDEYFLCHQDGKICVIENIPEKVIQFTATSLI